MLALAIFGIPGTIPLPRLVIPRTMWTALVFQFAAPDPEDFVDRRKQPGRRRRFRISVGEADTDRLGAIEQW
jgi:hypothetical protein